MLRKLNKSTILKLWTKEWKSIGPSLVVQHIQNIPNCCHPWMCFKQYKPGGFKLFRCHGPKYICPGARAPILKRKLFIFMYKFKLKKLLLQICVNSYLEDISFLLCYCTVLHCISINLFTFHGPHNTKVIVVN